MRSRYRLINTSESLPDRVIITDDPLRAKMLNAHHLEYSTTVYERGESLIYSGGYNGVPIAVISTGPGVDDVSAGFKEAVAHGAKEIIFIGACVSSTDRHGIRDVIIAAGGSRSLSNRAITAAASFGIPVSTRTVLPPDGEIPGEGCIIDRHTGRLYELAREKGVEALSILTVTENTVTGTTMEEHEVHSRFYAASGLVFELFAL